MVFLVVYFVVFWVVSCCVCRWLGGVGYKFLDFEYGKIFLVLGLVFFSCVYVMLLFFSG